MRNLAILATLLASCHAGEGMSGDASSDSPDGADVEAHDTFEVNDSAGEPDGDAPCWLAPPCPDGPADGIMGRECRTDLDCRDMHGSRCSTERIMEYDGEVYVYSMNGSCSFWGDELRGCDPDMPFHCPPGSRCLVLYDGRYSGCVDECAPADASGELHDWACGCRRGYECDINMGLCFSGCSNDRQCCESFRDENRNGLMDEGEVILYAECTSYCDGDDPEEWMDCRASFSCINPGAPDARIGGPCEHDSECPRDGTCLGWTDPETGRTYMPGGYCSRTGCQYAARGCEDAGGWCINTGSVERPEGICLAPCHVGRDLADPDYECRTTPGEEQVCMPVHVLGWIGGPPPGGEDGYCYPGNFDPGPCVIGDSCIEDSDCISPMGLGECQRWIGEDPFCTVRCNEVLAVERAVCGPAAEGEISPTICGWSMCWEGCLDPYAPPGENGCSHPGHACAPLSVLGTTYVPAGSLRPPGFCMPACADDDFCADFVAIGSTCDTLTGVCA